MDSSEQPGNTETVFQLHFFCAQKMKRLLFMENVNTVVSKPDIDCDTSQVLKTKLKCFFMTAVIKR